jgi:nitroimidazol reductase NimA-like FMN-containing flavoprotein (pyridoxamine 5'-phosphate oxidase superfamily)
MTDPQTSGDAAAGKGEKMRKSNREVKSGEEILGIIERCDACRIALPTGGAPYIVPLSFGYEYGVADPSAGAGGRGNVLTLWFHCALEGRKLDIIKDGCAAGFEMDTDHELKPGAGACGYSMNYASVIGNGRIAPVTDDAERLRGLDAIMKHYGGAGLSYDKKNLSLTCVLRLDVAEYACKRLKK